MIYILSLLRSLPCASAKETYFLNYFSNLWNIEVADNPHLCTNEQFEPIFLQKNECTGKFRIGNHYCWIPTEFLYLIITFSNIIFPMPICVGVKKSHSIAGLRQCECSVMDRKNRVRCNWTAGFIDKSVDLH